jgi:hypothetical protein
VKLKFSICKLKKCWCLHDRKKSAEAIEAVPSKEPQFLRGQNLVAIAMFISDIAQPRPETSARLIVIKAYYRGSVSEQPVDDRSLEVIHWPGRRPASSPL